MFSGYTEICFRTRGVPVIIKSVNTGVINNTDAAIIQIRLNVSCDKSPIKSFSYFDESKLQNICDFAYAPVSFADKNAAIIMTKKDDNDIYISLTVHPKE